MSKLPTHYRNDIGYLKPLPNEIRLRQTGNRFRPDRLDPDRYAMEVVQIVARDDGVRLETTFTQEQYDTVLHYASLLGMALAVLIPDRD